MTQQGDVLLYESLDGGEIQIVNGLVTLSGGLQGAVYLSMFGGNSDDDGRRNNPLAWWGNLIETQPERQYRSETQYWLTRLPPIPANLRRLEQAAARDLAWLVTVGAATRITVVATMPAINTVRIAVTTTIEGNPTDFVFVENWKADAA